MRHSISVYFVANMRQTILTRDRHSYETNRIDVVQKKFLRIILITVVIGEENKENAIHKLTTRELNCVCSCAFAIIRCKFMVFAEIFCNDVEAKNINIIVNLSVIIHEFRHHSWASSQLNEIIELRIQTKIVCNHYYFKFVF